MTSVTSTPHGLFDKGVPLAQVRNLLGHASITTTERYDNQKLENLQTAVLRLEREEFDPNDTGDAKRGDDRDKVSSFFQDHAKVLRVEKVRERPETEANLLDESDLANWLGVRDDFRSGWSRLCDWPSALT
jgi:hypothetical protein